jgi:hypothetical protein
VAVSSVAKLAPINHVGKRFVKKFTRIGDRKKRRNFEVNFLVAADVSRLLLFDREE